MSHSNLKVLAISPRFAPVNGADTHRLRLLLPHAAANGWHVEVLAVDAVAVSGPKDPWLEAMLPKYVPVHRVPAWQLNGWGVKGLSQRSFWALYRKGCELLATGRFDIMFFSTTEFPLHLLGVLWTRRFRVPFCMDYQDPWVNEYYRLHPDVIPPGGRVKYAIADIVHRLLERIVAPACSGFLSVSQEYLDDLSKRYGGAVAGKPTLVRPFPAEPDEVRGFLIENSQYEPVNAKSAIWRYIGRGGADMAKAARGFFGAWEMAIEKSVLNLDSVKFEARGTSYATEKGDFTFLPLVKETCLESVVEEQTERLTYSEMLRQLAQSDALIVFGSDDPAYTASKLYPYLFSGKPMLAIFHKSSSVVELIKRVGGGVCVSFDDDTSQDELAFNIYTAWFAGHSWLQPIPINSTTVDAITARTQAMEIGEWFGKVIESHS